MFDAGAWQLLNINDFAAGTSFRSITVSGSGYDLSGNAIDLTDGFVVTTGADVNMNIDVTLGGVQAFEVDAGGRLSYYGAISGNYDLTKTGGGVLALNNNYLDNTYTGTTIVNDGTVQLNSDHVGHPGRPGRRRRRRRGRDRAVPDRQRGLRQRDRDPQRGRHPRLQRPGRPVPKPRDAGRTVLTNGGTISVLTSITVNAASNGVTSTIQGPGSLDLASDDVVFAIADDPNLDIELRVRLRDRRRHTKTGAGVLALSGARRLRGTTTVLAGRDPGRERRRPGHETAGTTVAGNGLPLLFSGPSLSLAEPLLLSGADAGGNVLNVLSGDATLTGNVTITDGSPRIGAASGATLALDGVIDDGGSVYGLEIVNESTGRVVLGGSNLFGGPVAVKGGYLRATSDNALGNPSIAANVVLQDSTVVRALGRGHHPGPQALRPAGQRGELRDRCQAHQRLGRELHRGAAPDGIEHPHQHQFAFRSLRNQRGMSAIAIVCLALGIGANTAIFSVVRTVLLESLPYRDATRLSRLYESSVFNGRPGLGSVSVPNYVDIKRDNTAFEMIAATNGGGADLVGEGGQPERIKWLKCTADLFTVLGARPMLGRTFTAGEDEPGHNVVILSEGFFRRRFAGNAALIGKQISLNNIPYTVIGVMPSDFDYPISPVHNDAWVPLVFAGNDDATHRGSHWLQVVARAQTRTRLRVGKRPAAAARAAHRARLPERTEEPWSHGR